VTYLWSTSPSPGDVFTEYNCDASRFAGHYTLAAETPSAAIASTSSSHAKTSTTSPTSTAPRGSAASASASTSLSLLSFTVTNSTDTYSGSIDSPNIGVIVGCAVGAVAVLAILGIGVSLCIRKAPSRNPAPPGGFTSAPPPMAQFAGGLEQPHAPLGSSSPGTGSYSLVSDPRYNYGPGALAPPSPMSSMASGYPSPTGSPAPLLGQHQQPLGHEQWKYSHHGHPPAKVGPYAPAEMSGVGVAGYPAELA
jgi:hypothetical protein